MNLRRETDFPTTVADQQAKRLAVSVLAPVMALLDQAVETEDVEQYQALIAAAHRTGAAMMMVMLDQ
jgi:hypothetical protein